MLQREDLVDIIVAHLRPARPRGPAAGPGPRGRLFLSEREIKKRLTPGAQHLTIPEGAIISPLALDWLALEGIQVIRTHGR